MTVRNLSRVMNLLSIFLALATLPQTVWPAIAAEPPATPFLRLESGMHTAPINRIATDVKGRWIVTASNDKTARVWDIDSGRLLTVLRPPLGEGGLQEFRLDL